MFLTVTRKHKQGKLPTPPIRSHHRYRHMGAARDGTQAPPVGIDNPKPFVHGTPCHCGGSRNASQLVLSSAFGKFLTMTQHVLRNLNTSGSSIARNGTQISSSNGISAFDRSCTSLGSGLGLDRGIVIESWRLRQRAADSA